MARHNTCLYLGFGGSGSKTLAEFAELIAFHHEMGSRSESNFAFLLFDTFRDDLRKGEDRIRRAFEKAGTSPIVRTFCISQDYPTFNTKAGPKLQNAFLADTSRRLDAFWWSRDAKDGRSGRTPFTAVRFPHSPEIGAGQAPLISTFLTWHWLDAPGNNIRDMIRNTVNELKLRNTAAGHGQDLGLETTVVAGLAGGTGRGCWHLLSLIVSQILKDEDQTNHPIGLFYDASAFPEILAQRPEWKMKMTVNSLTGFSELVGFRRNELEKIDDCYHMSLPSLTRPSEPKADIIDTVDLVGRDVAGNPITTSGYGPVSRAFVVFGAGRAGSPGESTLYFKVGANVLYTRFIETIQGSGANTNEFGSVGCASFVVPIAEVVGYARRAVSLLAARRLIGETALEDIARIVDGFTKLVAIGEPGGAIESGARDVFGRVSHAINAEVDRMLDDVLGTPEENVRERLLDLGKNHPNSEQTQQKIRQLVEKALADGIWESEPDTSGKPGTLRSFVLEANERIGTGDGHAVAPSSGIKNPLALAVVRIVDAEKVAPGDGKPAVDLSRYGTKKAIAQQIKIWLEKEKKTIGDRKAESVQSPDAALKAYDESMSGLLSRLFSSSISPEKAEEIRHEMKTHYRKQCLDTMRDAVVAIFAEAADHVTQLEGRIDTVIGIFHEQSEKEDRELKQLSRETFWGEDDFARIIASGAGDVAYNTSILAETEIRPVAGNTDASLESRVDKALDEADKSNRRDGRGLEGALDEVRRRASAILRRSASGAAGGDGLRVALRKSIAEIGRQIELGQDFYRDNFSFSRVVRQHLLAWHRKWRELEHAPVTQGKLDRAFQMLFGTRMPAIVKEAGFASLPDGDVDKAVEDVCLQMAVQIGHRCDVLATQLSGDSYAIDRAAVILPAEPAFGEQFANDCQDRAMKGNGLFKANGLTVIPTFDDKGETIGDPFSMLGYASEDFNLGPIDDDRPLERVKSLTRQYEGNPEILAWLEACEDPAGGSVFVDGSSELKEADKCFGLGFSFPFMVRNERMRKCRWRPWARQAEAKREDAKKFADDALLFALLEAAPSDAEASLDWKMPLLVAPGTASVHADWTVARPAYRDVPGESVPKANHPDIPAGRSFKGILDVLKSLGTDAKVWIDVIAAEAAIYFGRILPDADTRLIPDRATKRLFDGLQSRLKTISAALPDADDMTAPSRKELDRLIARCETLRAMSCDELARHFGRRS